MWSGSLKPAATAAKVSRGRCSRWCPSQPGVPGPLEAWEPYVFNEFWSIPETQSFCCLPLGAPSSWSCSTPLSPPAPTLRGLCKLQVKRNPDAPGVNGTRPFTPRDSGLRRAALSAFIPSGLPSGLPGTVEVIPGWSVHSQDSHLLQESIVNNMSKEKGITCQGVNIKCNFLCNLLVRIQYPSGGRRSLGRACVNVKQCNTSQEP